MKLSWRDNEDVLEWTVSRSVDSGRTWSVVATIARDTLSASYDTATDRFFYTFTPDPPEVFRVVATSSAGDGPPSFAAYQERHPTCTILGVGDSEVAVDFGDQVVDSASSVGGKTHISGRRWAQLPINGQWSLTVPVGAVVSISVGSMPPLLFRAPAVPLVLFADLWKYRTAGARDGKLFTG